MLATASICALAACPRPAWGGGIRILPLGDSITQGGRSDREEYSYRLPLFRLLTEAGMDVDFIGSQTAGLNPDFVWPDDFDPDHEGHYGWKTAAVRDHLPEWMSKWGGAPDLALVHLGFNDQEPGGNYAATIAAPLRDIITMLREQNSRVVILVGHLGLTGGEGPVIRVVVEALVAEMNTDASPVVSVPHYKGWTENPTIPGSDTFDWAHPNPQGQMKMAVNWFAAMRPYLPASDASKP